MPAFRHAENLLADAIIDLDAAEKPKPRYYASGNCVYVTSNHSSICTAWTPMDATTIADALNSAEK
jgi:hypothetical protein